MWIVTLRMIDSMSYASGETEEEAWDKAAQRLLAECYCESLVRLNASLARERELQTRSDAWYEAAENYKLHLDAAESQLLAALTRERELQDKIKRREGWLEEHGDIIDDLEAAESQLLAKDALIASLKSEILKQNKAEDELLATGEKLAEERK